MKTLLLVMSLLIPGSVMAEGVLTPAANPPDAVLYDYRSTVAYQDDFLSGSISSGAVGKLGWTVAGGTTTSQASLQDHPGFFRRDTSAVISTLAYTALYPNSSALHTTTRAEWLFITRLNTNDGNTTVRVGAGNSFAAAPTDGIYFEKIDGDTNWFCVLRASSVETRVDSGVAVGTGWVEMGFKKLPSTGGITFLVDKVPVCTAIALTNFPTAGLDPIVHITTSAAASKTIDIEYFEMILSGISR